jgi:hypothetical protein
MRIAVAFILLLATTAAPPLRAGQADATRREKYDELLDQYVRDGFVYYRALKVDRRQLDAYVNSLANVSIDSAPRNDQVAFWLNAYNAVVLQTVVDHYPIPQKTTSYPPRSIRQIPGAFERDQHHLGGRMVTLDQIEQTIIPPFNDPRLFFALGRGAVGSGRLRSETYTGEALEKQLSELASECANHAQCLEIDRAKRQVLISSIFSWRSQAFIDTYAGPASGVFAARSPIERAVLAYVQPKLLTAEKEFLAENTFSVTFRPFDWSLNDLTGRGGR